MDVPGESIGVAQIAGGVIVVVSSCIVIREKGRLEERLENKMEERLNEG